MSSESMIALQESTEHPFRDEVMTDIELGRGLCFGTNEIVACEEYINTLEQCAQNPEYFLGKGGAGKVWAVHRTGFCLKVVENRPSETRDGLKFDLGNNAESEARFQLIAQKLNVQGVRAPVCVRVLRGGKYSGIVMEQLNAVSLEDVVLSRKKLPESYDHNVFFDALAHYLEQLHGQCGIVHGDLESRNIMVDVETGMPYVIDFGRSKFLPEDMKERRQQEEVDWSTYDRVEEQIQNLLNRNLFDINKESC